MKKIQRSFAVEYKSGRRKTGPKSNSIWGNMDLKSVAQDVQEEAMPFLPSEPRTGSSVVQASLPGADQARPLLTLPVGQQTTASVEQEIAMADENDVTRDADAPAAAAPDVLKRPRKPRANKRSTGSPPERATVSGAAAGKKRGRKARSDEDTSSVERPSLKRGRQGGQAAIAVPTAAIDEMMDLLQLEEENQRLRKLLAEKLRSENADLRKRLNLD